MLFVCVVVAVIFAPLPLELTTVTTVGVTPSPNAVVVKSIPVITPLLTLVTLPTTTVEIIIVSLTAYPVPPAVKFNAVTV